MSNGQSAVFRPRRHGRRHPRPAHGDDDTIQGEAGDDYLVSADDGEVFGADDVQGGSGNDTCVVDEDDAVSNCENVIIR